MARKWNIFWPYIHVLTRVNFTVEFVPRDSFLHEHHERLNEVRENRRIIEEENEKSLRKVMDREEANTPQHCQCYAATPRGVLSRIKLESSVKHKENPTSGFFKNNDSLAKNVESKGRESISNYINRRLSSFTLQSVFKSKLKEKCHTVLLNGLEYSYLNLIIFIIGTLIATMTTLKVFVFSTMNSHAEESTAQINARNCFQINESTNCQVETDLAQSSRSLWWWACQSFRCNMFNEFKNSRLLNCIATTLLLPTTLTRWSRFLALVYNIVRRLSKTEKLRKQNVNIVQMDLAYLTSLKATASEWCHILQNSFNHQHPLDDFHQESELVNKISSMEGVGPEEMGIKTKMYFYNWIQFDRCYKNYFRSDHFEKSDKPSMANDTTSWISLDEIPPPTIKNLPDERQNFRILDSLRSEPSLSVTANSKPSSANTCHLQRRLEDKNIFVARPTHRIDLNEMAWLLGMLTVLYTLSFISWFVTISFGLTVQMGLRALNDLNGKRFLLDLTKILNSFSLVSWGQLAIFQLLVVFAIFDLFNFFSCCLICFSRARYLKLHLLKIAQLCMIAGHHKDQFEIRRWDEVRFGGRLHSDPLGMHHFFKRQSQSTSSNQLNIDMVQDKARVSHINDRTKTIIGLTALIQRELNDLKRFFTTYLNLEITLKAMSLAFSVTAILEGRNIYELGYLIVNSNTCTTPIVIVLVTAALIETEFRGICKEMNRLTVIGKHVINHRNQKLMMLLSNHLSIKSNRSFVVLGNFSLSLGSLAPVIGWIATGVLLLGR